MSVSVIRVVHIDNDISIKAIPDTDPRFEVLLLPPEEVNDEDLRGADLVLVDWNIESWGNFQEDYEKLPLTCRPCDGLAIAANIRRHLKDECVPVCLLTSQLERLAGPVPEFQRQAEIARNHDLDWVFLKQDNGLLADRLASLHECIECLKGELGSEELNSNKLLGIEGHASIDALQRNVNESCPPVTDLSEWSHGIYWIRWFIQRILTYPCFLSDEWWLASRLWLNHDELTDEVKALFADAQYGGVLSDFGGRRWWRPLVEIELWKSTGGLSTNREAVHSWLREKLEDIQGLEDDAPHVVSRNEESLLPEGILPLGATELLHSDGWPVFSDPIRVSKEEA